MLQCEIRRLKVGCLLSFLSRRIPTTNAPCILLWLYAYCGGLHYPITILLFYLWRLLSHRSSSTPRKYRLIAWCQSTSMLRFTQQSQWSYSQPTLINIFWIDLLPFSVESRSYSATYLQTTLHVAGTIPSMVIGVLMHWNSGWALDGIMRSIRVRSRKHLSLPKFLDLVIFLALWSVPVFCPRTYFKSKLPPLTHYTIHSKSWFSPTALAFQRCNCTMILCRSQVESRVVLYFRFTANFRYSTPKRKYSTVFIV